MQNEKWPEIRLRAKSGRVWCVIWEFEFIAYCNNREALKGFFFFLSAKEKQDNIWIGQGGKHF
jgi:hypothetical protein